MDIQLDKIELMKLLKETENPSVIEAIKKIFAKEKSDWWDELPDAAKEGIEEGLKDFEEGRFVSYEEVKTKLGWK